ncbi:LMBR1-like membrane protein-domain-containing protein [Aspergillus avenaceus]|uniref:LMBR1-like membrane protein-domain-containing protein n=1 Tax=Aspergillus avenaceus TaxID=36643 RepID=A0A5N6TDF5_ASPAV|nr:LMBR1-like membrane protein-domain-containing protein [Aspergillus avenaceus]
MISISTISIGSSIFFSFALLTISLLVLLLLRRFLTLRATPAYLTIPVFLALALPASVVLLVPIDLASSSRDGGGPKAIWLPDRLILVSWRIAYWLIFVLTWAILPLLGEYIDSGYREPKGRIEYSIRSNARYQLIVFCCAIVGLIYISIQNGFEFTSIKALVMALAYVWGLVLAIYLMGHGLVSIPRTLFRNANVSGRLRRIQAYAPRLHDRLMDAVTDLESLESQVGQLQRRKTGSALEFREWIEELAETSLPSEQRSALLQPSDVSTTIPAVITARYMADLTRRLQRARHQKARFVDEWDRLVLTAGDLQAIINSSASKKLEFNHAPHRATLLTRVKVLSPYMRYHVYVHVVPNARLLFGLFFSAASVCVVWSELIKSLAPRLSVVTLSIVSYHHDPAPVGFGRQVTASAWLLYMCWAALVGVNDAKVWGNRALVRRNTYGESACWYAGLVARLTVPIAYNFLTFLPTSVRQNTTFYRLLGRFIDLTPLGKGFDYFFPVFILVPICATLFNLYGRVKNVCGFGLVEEEDEDLENNPSGYGLGGWREGRDLIERELNGLGSLTLSARNRSPQPSSHVEEGTNAFSSSRTPRGEAIRPSRPHRGAPTASTVLDNPEDEDNFFQSFAHRVKNTFETAGKPDWLQGDAFRLPRWMGSENAEGNSGLARWFGGRPAPGGLLSHVSQSSLGETCAFYLAHAKNKFPTSFDTIQDRFVSFVSAEAPLALRSLTLPTDWVAEHAYAADKSTIAFTVVACALVVFVMSWRTPFTNLFRRSPQYSNVSNPPHVSESDYSYITTNDIVDSSGGAYGNSGYTEPDTLLLKHKRQTYPLEFPAYAINDGMLSVGQLRQRAAEVTRTPDPKRIRLLYKGRLLENDSLPCRAEGLKQQSEVLCVVSEVQPGESTPSDGSDAEDKASDSAHPDDVASTQKRTRNRNRNKKNKNKNKNKNKRSDDGAEPSTLAPPADQPKPSPSPSRSALPPSAPNLKAFPTALEQVQALTSYFHTVLLPLCDEYIVNPPTDPKAREYEHKKLGETILAQVILKADGIEPDGHEGARNARRMLIKETQATLNKIDQVEKA